MLSYRRALLIALLATAVTAAVELISDLLVVANPRWMFIDETAMAVLVGGLVIIFERWRSRHVAERLRIIRDMNRYVRNELQVLVAASQSLGNSQSVSEIERAVDRIDWALREVLPGKCIPRENTPPLPFQKADLDRSA